MLEVLKWVAIVLVGLLLLSGAVTALAAWWVESLFKRMFPWTFK